MNRHEHLMVRAMEECNELSQRISKALIFGLGQIQQKTDDKPEQNPQKLTNRQRIIEEYHDLLAVLEMLGFGVQDYSRNKIFDKIIKVEKYLRMSKELGTLQED